MDDDKGSLQDAAAKALTGRAPFYGALNYGTSFSLLYTYSPLRDEALTGRASLRTYRTLHREGRQRGLTGRRDEVAR